VCVAAAAVDTPRPSPPAISQRCWGAACALLYWGWWWWAELARVPCLAVGTRVFGCLVGVGVHQCLHGVSHVFDARGFSNGLRNLQVQGALVVGCQHGCWRWDEPAVVARRAVVDLCCTIRDLTQF
jgi:hypothetical protein